MDLNYSHGKGESMARNATLRKEIASMLGRLGRATIRQQVLSDRIDRLGEDRVTRPRAPVPDPVRVFDERARELMAEENVTYEEAYRRIKADEPEVFIAYKTARGLAM